MKVRRPTESRLWNAHGFSASRSWSVRPTPVSGLTALLLLFLFSPASLFAQDLAIEKYQSHISIYKDSSFTVTESLNVVFSRAKHGIYREIPYRYVDELGNTVYTPITVSSVTDGSGKPWKYRVRRQGNVVYIRIGDPDTYVSGTQTYVITYRVENALLFLQDHDELYWNVTGNYWKAPIGRAEAVVALDRTAAAEPVVAACYTGLQGSRESACRILKNNNGSTFYTTTRLNEGEGLTIRFGWPKGLVTPPSAWRKLFRSWDFGRYWVYLLPLAALLTMIRLWVKKGRDPKVRQAVTVTYGPPKYLGRELIAAETGALLDERLDPRDVTAAIVGLAVKGYVRIEEEIVEGWIFDSSDYLLSKVKGADENLNHFEQALLDKVFADNVDSVRISDLKNRFYKHLEALQKAIFDGLVAKHYFTKSPEQVRRFYLAVGVVTAILSALVFAVLPDENPHGIPAGILTGVTIMFFSRFMPAKTADGALAHSQILGFQEFLNRAEKDRLQRMEDKNLFSKFLPYAIALDVAENWCKAFAGIYQEPPQWYVSSRPVDTTTFNPRSFSSSLKAMTSSITTAVFTSPRGSGGSGGSSGGGFGGGGGGSW